MKKNIRVAALLSLLLLGLSPLTHGAGFLIYEHGAAAMAMGGAFIAVANNPTAIFHNPAGIAWLEGTQISLGTTLITSKSSLSLPNYYVVDPTYPEFVDQESQWFYPSTFYISHKISDNVTAGFGFFSPYGLGAKWPEDYPLRFIAIEDDMKTFFFNPTIAIKLNENLSVAAGVSYIYATLNVKLVKLVDLTDYDGSIYEAPMSIDANGSRWALNAGALYKGENFSFGFNWRGGFKIKYDGDIDPDKSQIPSVFQALVPDEADVSATFNFPHIFGVGTAFNLTESLILTADVHYILWSAYDKLEIEYDYPDPYPDPPSDEIDEDWKDSFVLRGGLQYNLNENFALRAGILYDQTPQPKETMDPMLPDANRWALTGGFGYKAGSFVINVAYQFEIFSDRTSPNRDVYLDPISGFNAGLGTYSTTAHLIGISIGFVF